MFGRVCSLTLRVVSVKSLRIINLIKTKYTSTINVAFTFLLSFKILLKASVISMFHL